MKKTVKQTFTDEVFQSGILSSDWQAIAERMEVPPQKSIKWLKELGVKFPRKRKIAKALPNRKIKALDCLVECVKDPGATITELAKRAGVSTVFLSGVIGYIAEAGLTIDPQTGSITRKENGR